MNTSHFSDTKVSTPNDSGGKTAFDNRQQSRIPQSSFDFKKPRFSERNSYPRIPLSVNRSKLYIPYKSELCSLFQRGKCYYGENCHFSHSMSEIRKPGFNTVGFEEHMNEDSKRYAMSKTRVCHWFASGSDCPYGHKCQYLHRCDQKVRRDQINCRNLNSGSEDYYKLLWKTKLCMRWERFGKCANGEKCTYAHGKAELQEPGYHAGLGHRYTTSRSSMLASQPYDAASCEVGMKITKKLHLKGKTCFMKWDIEKISQIYADWMDDEHNFHV